MPSDVTLPRKPALTVALLLTGAPLLTLEAVLAVETSPQSTTIPAKLPLSSTSPTTPGGALEGRSSRSTPTPESPPPPPQTVSPTPAENEQPQEEPPEDCCVCYEALAAPKYVHAVSGSPLAFLSTCWLSPRFAPSSTSDIADRHDFGSCPSRCTPYSVAPSYRWCILGSILMRLNVLR